MTLRGAVPTRPILLRERREVTGLGSDWSATGSRARWGRRWLDVAAMLAAWWPWPPAADAAVELQVVEFPEKGEPGRVVRRR